MMIMEASAGNPRLGARFEFRVFGPGVGRFSAQLGPHARRTDKDRRTDRYFVGPAFRRYSLKLRGQQQLDAKRLLRREGKIEQWQPLFKLDFPLDRSVLEAELPPAILRHLSPGRVLFETAEAFSEAMSAAGRPRVACVDVSKSRTRYDADGFSWESAIVSSNGWTTRSLAIESLSASLLHSVLWQAGLGGECNVNYQDFLARISDC
ncbi:MAG: hypothetical protein KKB37_16400 [Alphaproteobacteria bacterium]|nr:hypothetical protein [Alphaproteobacteria bacterium]